MSNDQALPATTLPDDAVAETPFYIPATGTPTRPRRDAQTRRHASSSSTAIGDIGASAGEAGRAVPHRHALSLASRVAGERRSSRCCSARICATTTPCWRSISPTRTSIVDGQIVLQKDMLHIVAHDLSVARHRLSAARGAQSRRSRASSLSLSLLFRQRLRRSVRGARACGAPAAAVPAQRVIAAGSGAAELSRASTACRAARRSPSIRRRPSSAPSSAALPPRACAATKPSPIFLIDRLRPAGRAAARGRFFSGLLAARRELRDATRDTTTVETSNELFNEILCRSVADLAMLMTDTPQGRYPYAGIPWYSTTFGRDGLITALQMLWCDPGIARGVLRRLAAYQADDDDPPPTPSPARSCTRCAPARWRRWARCRSACYYGSVDATPLFVHARRPLCRAHRRSRDRCASCGRTSRRRSAGSTATAIRDGDGFVEYRRASRARARQPGLEGLGGCDLPRRRPPGRGPDRARRGAGLRLRRQARGGAPARGGSGRRRARASSKRDAERLRERFEAAFWCPELGTYALALDGDEAAVPRAHLERRAVLFTGIAQPERAAQVGERAAGAALLLRLGHPHPRAAARRATIRCRYHNGSVWPHDNALIALGFARYGFKRAVAQVFKGLFDAATYMDLRRLPELFCGFQRAAQPRARRSIRSPARRRPGRAPRRSR